MVQNTIDVRGRGLKCTRITVRPDGAGVTIRVDDDENPETWVEIRHTVGGLVQLVGMCQDAKGCEEAEERYQAAKRTLPGLDAGNG